MILELSIRNWLSFREEAVFTMAATGEKRLRERLPVVRRCPLLSVSPVAVLYGGNASGKTNFFRVFSFLRKMVVSPNYDGHKEIPLERFLLADDGRQSPCEISLTILASDERIYTFELGVNRVSVLYERLSLVKRSGSVPLYVREGDGKVELHQEMLLQDKDAMAFAQVVSHNQLFLGIAGSRVASLRVVWQWFSKQLTLISTHASFGGYMDMFEKQPTDIEQLSVLLKELDTGICKLALEDSTFSAIPIQEGREADLKEHMREGEQVEINVNGLRYLVSKRQGDLQVKKMISYHRDAHGNLVRFDLRQESEGTLRLLDILPAFIDLERKESRAVFVIDEFDCSWHYLLSRRLLGIYLSNCSKNTRSQLIFSTHDLMLMDQELFRRDEMWVTERKEDGSSVLLSFGNCNVRYDKDIRKLYLQGALGGIPQLARFGSFGEKGDRQ